KSPVLATSPARIDALNCVALMKVVERLLPLSRTVAPLTKLVPITNRLNPGEPAPTPGGESAVIPGTGLAPGGVIVKFCVALVPPPGAGVTTVTCAVPWLATRFAGTCAVNCVALPNAVCNSVPFHRTFEVTAKLEPLAVSANVAEPAG